MILSSEEGLVLKCFLRVCWGRVSWPSFGFQAQIRLKEKSSQPTVGKLRQRMGQKKWPKKKTQSYFETNRKPTTKNTETWWYNGGYNGGPQGYNGNPASSVILSPNSCRLCGKICLKSIDWTHHTKKTLRHLYVVLLVGRSQKKNFGQQTSKQHPAPPYHMLWEDICLSFQQPPINSRPFETLLYYLQTPQGCFETGNATFFYLEKTYAKAHRDRG